jgi:Predicted enzyme related to lactoylglutathione lyase
VNRVVHFEIAAEDPERVAQFYSKVFGWKFEKWQGPFDYWLVKTGEDSEPGINGGLNRKMNTNQICTVNTIAVESIDSTIQKIVRNGGKVIREKQRFLVWGIWHTVKMYPGSYSGSWKAIYRQGSIRLSNRERNQGKGRCLTL